MSRTYIYKHEFMFIYVHWRLLMTGLAIWAAATIVLRIAGQYMLRPPAWRATLILFVVSFPAMAWVARQLCAGLKREDWPVGAISLVLPTLLLDPFSSAFFPVVFPNIAPRMAGVFGGWMLWCCAGAFTGVIVGRGTKG